MRQYHPLFAHFLRKSLGEHYEVLTSFAVGELPRQADVVVLRRTALRGPQFRHLWRWLTTWNVLEFKAPTVSPRESHLDLLLELGLGVARRLNEQRAHDKLRPLSYQQISWWYVVRKLSDRLREKWEQRLGGLEEVERGVWRSAVGGYPLYLVSTKVWKKERAMAGKMIDDNLEIDWKLMAEEFGLDGMIRQIGLGNLIEEAGVATVIEEVGLARVVEEVGLGRVVDEVGLGRVVEEVGLARVVEEVGIDKLLVGLSPEQRAQLRQRL
jgi:hypothetical protein